MFGQTFYHGFTKKYITIFGTLFNNIKIDRVLDDGAIQTAKVPMTYSSQDKMLARVMADPGLDRKVAAFSPAISFQCGTPMYDPARKLASTLQRCLIGPDGTKTQFIGVPYNLEFTLVIYAKQEEDGLRVLEQILPYFTPSLSVNAELMPNYNVDIPIVLNDIQFENNSYGEFLDRRSLIWTLRFTMKAEYAGPVIGGPRKLIKIVHANILDKTTRSIMEEVHAEVGLTANGQPTSVRADSIPVAEIKADDDYGFIFEINEGPEPHSE